MNECEEGSGESLFRAVATLGPIRGRDPSDSLGGVSRKRDAKKERLPVPRRNDEKEYGRM